MSKNGKVPYTYILPLLKLAFLHHVVATALRDAMS